MLRRRRCSISASFSLLSTLPLANSTGAPQLARTTRAAPRRARRAGRARAAAGAAAVGLAASAALAGRAAAAARALHATGIRATAAQAMIAAGRLCGSGSVEKRGRNGSGALGLLLMQRSGCEDGAKWGMGAVACSPWAHLREVAGNAPKSLLAPTQCLIKQWQLRAARQLACKRPAARAPSFPAAFGATVYTVARVSCTDCIPIDAGPDGGLRGRHSALAAPHSPWQPLHIPGA